MINISIIPSLTDWLTLWLTHWLSLHVTSSGKETMKLSLQSFTVFFVSSSTFPNLSSSLFSSDFSVGERQSFAPAPHTYYFTRSFSVTANSLWRINKLAQLLYSSVAIFLMNVVLLKRVFNLEWLVLFVYIDYFVEIIKHVFKDWVGKRSNEGIHLLIFWKSFFKGTEARLLKNTLCIWYEVRFHQELLASLSLNSSLTLSLTYCPPYQSVTPEAWSATYLFPKYQESSKM